MAKSKNINLNLTPEIEIAQTLFDEWRQSIDGYNGANPVNPSNFEILDSEIGRINAILETVSTLKFEKVTELPDKSQAKENIIYLVPASNTGEKNYYEEYIFLKNDNKYELIGSTQITFDNEPTEGSQNGVTSGGVYTALQNKQDTIQDLNTIRSGSQKGETAVQPSDLATVATTGSYNDLSDKPTIPLEQVQVDWNQTDSDAVDYIKNKPDVEGMINNEQSRATEAEAGLETEIGNLNTKVDNLPIPEVNNPTITFIQGGKQKGQITLNQTSDQTIQFAGGETSDYSSGNGITIDENNVINADIKKIELKGNWEVINQLTPEQCESLNVGDLVSVRYPDTTIPRSTILFEVVQKSSTQEQPWHSDGSLVLAHRSDNPSDCVYVYYIQNSEYEYVYDRTENRWLKELTDDDNVHYWKGSSGDVHASDLRSIGHLGYIVYEESEKDYYFSCNLYVSKDEEISREESSESTFNLSSTINSDGEYYVAIVTPVAQSNVNEEEEDPIVATYEIVKKSINGADVDAIYEDLNLPKIPDPTRTTTSQKIENLIELVDILLNDLNIDSATEDEYPNEAIKLKTYQKILKLATKVEINSSLIDLIADDLGLSDLGSEEYPIETERTPIKQDLTTLKRIVNILLDDLCLSGAADTSYPNEDSNIKTGVKLQSVIDLVNLIANDLGLNDYVNNSYPSPEEYIATKDKLMEPNPSYSYQDPSQDLNSLKYNNTIYKIPKLYAYTITAEVYINSNVGWAKGYIEKLYAYSNYDLTTQQGRWSCLYNLIFQNGGMASITPSTGLDQTAEYRLHYVNTDNAANYQLTFHMQNGYTKTITSAADINNFTIKKNQLW